MYAKQYISETVHILSELPALEIEHIVDELGRVRQFWGRVFVLGVGGSAATASHMVNDLRKMAGIDAYAPTDNVAELTARTNDDGWATTFRDWLRVSRVSSDDALLVISVGGGMAEASPNIIGAIDYAKSYATTVLGIVGRSGGHTAQRADACVVIPALYDDRITPHTEGIASVVCHLIVSHPRLAR